MNKNTLKREAVKTLENAITLIQEHANYKAFLIYFGKADYIIELLADNYDYYITEENDYLAELFREADKLIIDIKAELWED